MSDNPLAPNSGGTGERHSGSPESGREGISIRPAQALDLPAIITLWRTLQDINASYDPRLTLNARADAWFLGYLRDNLDNPNMAIYVADHGGSVIGYTFGQIMQRPTLQSGDCGYIADVCVRDGWRRQGAGRQLHSRLKAWFLSRGITAIEVQVIRANPASQAFWRKMGYNDFLRTLRSETHPAVAPATRRASGDTQ